MGPQRKDFKRERIVSSQTENYAHKMGRHKLRIDKFEKETIENLRNVKVRNVRKTLQQEKSSKIHRVILWWVWLKREPVTWRLEVRNTSRIYSKR